MSKQREHFKLSPAARLPSMNLEKDFLWGLRVAQCSLWYWSDSPWVHAIAPPIEDRFTVFTTAEEEKASAVSRQLVLQVNQAELSRDLRWQQLVYRTKIWELWKDDQDFMIFYNPMQSVLRVLRVAPDFSAGQVDGDFRPGEQGADQILPRELEIVLFANWLGSFGDLILHAAGVKVNGAGYAFVGHSGAGKSTLAALLAQIPNVTLLGEDQVVVRKQAKDFWIYGTPWHYSSSRCAPEGAPLKALFFLDGKGENTLQSIAPMEGVSRLLQTAFVPYYQPQFVQLILANLADLAQQTPLRTFNFDKSSSPQYILSRILI